MAKPKPRNKKKSDSRNQHLQNQPVMEETHESPSEMEDQPIEKKVTNLKMLNSKLLEETAEDREEIKALKESKNVIETELIRTLSEVESLRSELIKAQEAEVANGVVSVFMESQVVELLRREKEDVEKNLEEMKQEMSYVVKDRDEIEKAKFDGDIQIGAMKKREKDLWNELKREKEVVKQMISERDEVKQELRVRDGELNRLKEKIDGMGLKKRSVAEELEGLKLKYDVTLTELKEKENELGILRGNCEDLRREIEGLNGEKEEVSRKIDELRNDKENRNVRISELENEVNELNAVVLNVKENEEKWRLKFIKLEECNVGLVTELKGLKDDFSDLMEEKNGKEQEISRLEAEKSRVGSSLNELEKEIKSAKRFHEEVLGENNRLQNELNDIRGNLSLVQESNRVELEKNKKLASEIDDHKRALNQVTNERDDAKKASDLEKKNGMMLQVKVSEISKKMEETAKVIEGLKAASDTLVEEKKEIENKYGRLVEEKKLVDDDNIKAKEQIDVLTDLMNQRSVMFTTILSMMKNAVEQVSAGNENKAEDEEMKLNVQDFDELKPIVEELKAMRLVFKEQGKKAGEELENLECSLKEVKKKSFWTLISSATTVLAVVASYAYASRVR